MRMVSPRLAPAPPLAAYEAKFVRSAKWRGTSVGCPSCRQRLFQSRGEPMTDFTRTDIVASSLAEADPHVLSWRAILAGGFAAAALTLVLLAFGSAVGFSSISPWSNSGISASTFHIAGGIYLVVVAMLSSTVGGYIAGR